MDNKKFEQLIELVINENHEQANALFHDIVVEKSREIYESMMDDDMAEGQGMGGEVGDMIDEISAESAGGVVEGEDDEVLDIEDGEDDEVIDLDTTDDEIGGGDDEVEDTLVRIEDKLDELMAEFEEIMAGDDAEVAADDEFDAGEEAADDEFAANDEEDAMMEAIQLKNVPGLYGSKIGGDNGQQTKSTVTANSGAKGMASKPVSFSGATETVPTSPKGPSNAYSKGEKQVKDANNWKNAPAQAGQDLEKAPAPKHGDDGSNAKSPVAESRTAKKRI